MTYTLFGGELSLFTRKLEAAMKFTGSPFDFVAKNSTNREHLELRSGTHQVPVLQTPENWVLADTTPIIDLLDTRVGARRLFPEGAMGVLVHVMEEHFDEWIARTMVHYRWHYPESAAFAASRMANGDESVARRMLDWGPRACRATGTDSQLQQRAAEAEYERILVAAEAQLTQTAFLLGDRPTALDCIVLGGLRAHTNMDPDPKRIVAKFPTVRDWCERRADTWDGQGALASINNPTDFALHVLEEMTSTYVPYMQAMRSALAAGAKACQVEIYGETVSYLARAYPEKSRNMVSNRIALLSGSARKDAHNFLDQWKLTHLFGVD